MVVLSLAAVIHSVLDNKHENICIRRQRLSQPHDSSCIQGLLVSGRHYTYQGLLMLILQLILFYEVLQYSPCISKYTRLVFTLAVNASIWLSVYHLPGLTGTGALQLQHVE